MANAFDKNGIQIFPDDFVELEDGRVFRVFSLSDECAYNNSVMLVAITEDNIVVIEPHITIKLTGKQLTMAMIKYDHMEL